MVHRALAGPVAHQLGHLERRVGGGDQLVVQPLRPLAQGGQRPAEAGADPYAGVLAVPFGHPPHGGQGQLGGVGARAAPGGGVDGLPAGDRRPLGPYEREGRRQAHRPQAQVGAEDLRQEVVRAPAHGEQQGREAEVAVVEAPVGREPPGGHGVLGHAQVPQHRQVGVAARGARVADAQVRRVQREDAQDGGSSPLPGELSHWSQAPDISASGAQASAVRRTSTARVPGSSGPPAPGSAGPPSPTSRPPAAAGRPGCRPGPGRR